MKTQLSEHQIAKVIERDLVQAKDKVFYDFLKRALTQSQTDRLVSELNIASAPRIVYREPYGKHTEQFKILFTQDAKNLRVYKLDGYNQNNMSEVYKIPLRTVMSQGEMRDLGYILQKPAVSTSTTKKPTTTTTTTAKTSKKPQKTSTSTNTTKKTTKKTTKSSK